MYLASSGAGSERKNHKKHKECGNFNYFSYENTEKSEENVCISTTGRHETM